MLRLELPGNRFRGRPKRRFFDAVKEDVGVNKEDAENIIRNRWISCCGDHYRD